jgi:transketolase
MLATALDCRRRDARLFVGKRPEKLHFGRNEHLCDICQRRAKLPFVQPIENVREFSRERFERWSVAFPAARDDWDQAWRGEPKPGWQEALPEFKSGEGAALATRDAGHEIMQALEPFTPKSSSNSLSSILSSIYP